MSHSTSAFRRRVSGRDRGGSLRPGPAPSEGDVNCTSVLRDAEVRISMDGRGRKPFTITLDTVYIDSCGVVINIILILNPDDCKR